MVRILVPITYSELGGSQVFLLKLIDGMQAEKAFSFHFWLFEQGPLEKELTNRKIPYRIVQFPMHRDPFFLIRMIVALRKDRPDVIYLHATRFMALAAKIAGIPCVERINMSRNTKAGGWCSKPWIDRLFTSFNTKALAVSDAIRRQLVQLGISERKICVIRNFVELERFQPSDRKIELRKELGIPEGLIIVLNVGRFMPQKAQTDFLKIAANALKRNPDLFFVLVGDGPMKAMLEQEADALNLQGHLQIMPFRKDVENIYAASDILLHTAHWDPLANVLLEGMATELTVIATNVDGTSEVIEHDKNGMLFPAGDISKGTDCLLEAAANPVIRKKYGLTARESMEKNHSLAFVLRKYKELFVNPRL